MVEREVAQVEKKTFKEKKLQEFEEKLNNHWEDSEYSGFSIQSTNNFLKQFLSQVVDELEQTKLQPISEEEVNPYIENLINELLKHTKLDVLIRKNAIKKSTSKAICQRFGQPKTNTINLNEEKYNEFLKKLDEPPKELPELKKLFSQPQSVDERKNNEQKTRNE